ncbi:MAG: keto-deoxy-phosphogluconate aldolase [Alteromonadaceae bacterium]|jgi:2-dehydro-3-deoxyphosphogluconate aldolase/(4S)-4-hydroxy-2-oxoglutarate aldolase|uniref:2-dehydro-3-deoxy-phosphogluconate aldolase n=1 Tax=Rheinheimera aquimaris TaxID=412437 RepID=A0ABN1DGK2_9GAMM|nr:MULTISPECIES: bifunctional 4-hydroxy-2-oxoglutarate aldolase/2-dehydro-3-deoxy-phosphogluconate aldolase [Rheinheimera]MBJ91809.1 keto-deoxy-phosphogluconate aldolase [Alteromonadaceae bacterium]MBJ92432.1 keto-deoxy-phosphogluconate aldolase [Alteromonadaceae bacterium]MCB5212075.1 bifunctional 4-hydroxy-2-oxoglutarate aldolase/2-dehydro-3-deoxy-phosphogluconate aldolase [Rheinheimera aquimaris]HBN90176.1 keto-deoxy-phosphogluconate aldolase [Rheinheimera sp.]|tara:strand:+ start:199 stop:846 length:648 start_codon:yes stop_codon:yes gene_type:complete
MAFENWQLQPDTLFAQGPVVPVIVVKDLADAVPMAKALLAGGIKVLEVTLRTPVALDAIRLLAQEVPDAIVGAGTVTTPEQLQQCIDAGAKFAISPGLTRELLQAGKDAPIPLIPGIASISELMEGTGLGYSHFKFFPAEAAGGVKTLKSIHGPFADIRFCPTGGINEKNFLEYLALPNVKCVGGSWIVPDDAVSNKDWARITELCNAAVAQSQR